MQTGLNCAFVGDYFQPQIGCNGEYFWQQHGACAHVHLMIEHGSVCNDVVFSMDFFDNKNNIEYEPAWSLKSTHVSA